MSTRSFIGICENNTVQGIYCHFDGYISHNGKILHKYYNTIEKIKELIDLGNISYLAPNLYPDENKPHTFENPQEDVVLAYHRDRNEDKESYTFNNETDFKKFLKDSWIEYIYIFYNNQWIVINNNNDKFYEVPLISLINKEQIDATPINLLT